MSNNNDLGRAMNDLTGWLYKRYNGILIERSGTGYKVGDRFYGTWDDMVKGRNEIRKIIYKSIKKP